MTIKQRNDLLFRKHSFQVKALANVLLTFFNFAQISYIEYEKRFVLDVSDLALIPSHDLALLNALICRFSISNYFDNGYFHIKCL